MKKKSLIILFTFLSFLLISTTCFANDIKNDVHNTTDSIIDGITSTTEKAREGVGAVENTFENTVSNTANTIENVVDDAGNTMSNIGQGVRNTYTALRTSTEDNSANTMTSYTPWIIIAAAVAIIIGLTWYYLAQTSNYNN